MAAAHHNTVPSYVEDLEGLHHIRCASMIRLGFQLLRKLEQIAKNVKISKVIVYSRICFAVNYHTKQYTNMT